MIELQKSVGKAGKNHSGDVVAVQIALYRLGHLSADQLLAEINPKQPSNNWQQIKQAIEKGTTFQTAEVVAQVDASKALADRKLKATLQAIRSFQKNKLGFRNPDGRIDPGGRTEAKINEHLANLTSSINADEAPAPSGKSSVEQNGDHLVIQVSATGKSLVKRIAVAEARRYLINNYNWNGLIRLLEFAYRKNKDSYEVPTNLTGTNADDALIIPDQGVLYLVRLQLANIIKKQNPVLAI